MAGLLGLGEALQGVEPSPPRAFEIAAEGAQRPLSGAVISVPAVPADVDQSGVSEHLQVLGNRSEGDLEPCGEVPGAPLVVPDQAEDFSPPGQGEGGKGIGDRHAANIL
jgi:hypothetical protein